MPVIRDIPRRQSGEDGGGGSSGPVPRAPTPRHPPWSRFAVLYLLAILGFAAFVWLTWLLLLS